MAAFTMLHSEFGYSRQESFAQTELLVKTAVKHGGLVFGGYVRDIIIPLTKLNRSLDRLDFKDLDFWFKSHSDAKAFIQSVGLTPSNHETLDKPSGRYPVCRNQHWSHYGGKRFVIVDVMITDFFPVCDFSVNLVSWDGASLAVHKPYDIISHVARNILLEDDLLRNDIIKLFTIGEIHSGLKLYRPGRDDYSLDDLHSYLDTLKPTHETGTSMTSIDRAFYSALIKDREFKSYTLDTIVEQISFNVYDTSHSFSWMAKRGSNYPKFKNIASSVSSRIEQFKNKTLGGYVIKHDEF